MWKVFSLRIFLCAKQVHQSKPLRFSAQWKALIVIKRLNVSFENTRENFPDFAKISAMFLNYAHAIREYCPIVRTSERAPFHDVSSRNYKVICSVLHYAFPKPFVISRCNRASRLHRAEAIITVFKLTSKEPSSLCCIICGRHAKIASDDEDEAT